MSRVTCRISPGFSGESSVCSTITQPSRAGKNPRGIQKTRRKTSDGLGRLFDVPRIVRSDGQEPRRASNDKPSSFIFPSLRPVAEFWNGLAKDSFLDK